MRGIDQDLFNAVMSNKTDQVKFFLHLGADIEAKDKTGCTVLMEAIWYRCPEINRCPEIIRLLVKAGADVNTSSNTGHTPLMRAAYLGEIEVTRLLLEAGADVHATTTTKRTALSRITTRMNDNVRQREYPHNKIAELLKQYGAKE